LGGGVTDPGAKLHVIPALETLRHLRSTWLLKPLSDWTVMVVGALPPTGMEIAAGLGVTE
jgi:hypothetical protein